MKSIIKLVIGSVVLLLVCQSCGLYDEYLFDYEKRMVIGDDSKWSAKNYDDSAWEYDYREVDRGDVFWIRFKLNFPEGTTADSDNLGILTISEGAFEVFFDGELLGRNGRLESSSTSEIPGQYHTYFMIPDSLQHAGEHRIAMRGTSMSNDTPYAFVTAGEYEQLLTAPLHSVKYLFLIAGAFLITAVYFFFMYFQQPKEYAILIFGIVCSLFFALILMEYLKYFYAYLYPFQKTRMITIGYLHMAITILIPWYFMIHFSFPWKKTALALILSAIIFIENYYDSYDWSAWTNDQLMWVASFLLVAFAAYQRKKGAVVTGIGLLVVSLLARFVSPYFEIPFISPYDVSLFIGFVVILLLMLYLLTLKRAAERKKYESSLVESERLKNELLKKNIKPHFIMNTLTSLIDWVEESPKEGVQFINALAGEFEILNQIADYKLVSIQQEIALCKNHLKVMRYRKEINYIWEDVTIDVNEIIPPAIIHTAVENGVTHSLPDEKGNITFRLTYNKTNTNKEYCLQTFAKNRPVPPKEFSKAEGGTGLKYIKSRLRESYGDDWQLTSEAFEGGWEVRIHIKC